MKRLISLMLSPLFALSAHAAPVPVLPPMVTIPAGQFQMGSANGPAGGGVQPVDRPLHQVAIKSFQLSPYELTVGQFRQFVAATGHQTGTECWKSSAREPGMEYGPGSWDSAANAPTEFHPVMCVSWQDATAYAAWLSKASGNHYRLPTEAEWEYAARAGSTGAYAFGDDPSQLCRYANVMDRTGAAAQLRAFGREIKPVDCDDFAATTSVVGMYLPNTFGLYDMTGNVGELVEDCQHTNYEGAPRDGSAWQGQCVTMGGEEMKIHRGGGYNNRAVGARIATRGHTGVTNYSSVGEGFRLAMDLPAKVASVDNGFMRALAAAQQAERQRRAAAK